MPSVAVLPPSLAPTGFAPSYSKMQNGYASPHRDTVAEIKAAAKEQVQTVRGASATSLLRAARDQIQMAKAQEGSGDLKDALSSLTKAISLTQMFMETGDFKQEMGPGKKGVLTKDFLNFQQNEGSDLTSRMQRVESKLAELDRAAAREAEAESTVDGPVRKPGGSIADRMRALQNAGLSVSPTKLTSKRLSKDLQLSSLPSLPSSPAVPQTPSFASTSSAATTPAIPSTPSFAPGPLSPDMPRPQRMSLHTLQSPSISSSGFTSTSAASTSAVPPTPTFSSGPLSPDASKPQRMSLHALQPPLIPSSNNVSPLASSSTSPSPHTLIPASSFGPPSPTSSTSSSPRMSSRLSLTDFNHNFPSIDEMDEMEGLKLPSAPPLNTLTTGSSKYSDHALDNNSPVSTFSKQFPALPIDPGPRPSSTPIPHIDTFNSRPSSPMRSPLLPSVPRKLSNLALNGGQRSPLIPQITPPEKRELPNALFPAILRDYKNKPNFKVLILDVRPRHDFEAEHIKADAVVCIEPSVLLRDNVSADSIETSLAVAPRHESMLFSNRDKFDLIAVCDESSRSMNDSPALMALERAIYEQAFRKILKNIPLLLVGGMSAWRTEFGAEELVRGGADGSSESPNASNGALSSAAGTAPTNGIFAPRPNNPIVPLVPLPSSSLASGHTRAPAESSTSAAFSSPLLDSTSMGRSMPTAPVSDVSAYKMWVPPPGTTMTPVPPEIPMASRPVVQDRREPPPLARKPAISRPPSNSVSFPSTIPENVLSHRSSPSLANGIQYPSINRTISPQMSGSSFDNNHTMNGFVSLPPQASINPSPLSRRRSDYIDQSQEALAGIHNRPSIDYPELSSQHILRPPPAVAASSMERQDSRPRILQHTIPKPPTIQSDYPVTYWSDNQIGMSGLKNLGNTCYMNSTIQCLSATVPFARFFTDGRWKSAVNMVNPMGTKGVLAQAFAGILRDMWQGEMPSLNPLPFRRTVCTFAKQFSGSEQHDSQEFLSVLLDGLHEDLNRVLNKPTIEMSPEREAELEKLPTQLASEQQWQIYRMRDDSLVVDFFQGQYRSRLECMTCHKTSTTYNTFMYLTLPIPTGRGNSKVSIQHCLDAFVKEEVMEKSDAWNCPNCKQLRRATKLLSLSRLPPVLLIHLKRFSVKGHFTEKIETFVDFPLQNLDLTNYMPPPLPPGVGGASSHSADDPRAQLPPYRYDLYGVTNHFGTLSSGHYTAFISSRGGWMYCDDSRIAPADPKDVVGKPAYILFYKRTKA